MAANRIKKDKVYQYNIIYSPIPGGGYQIIVPALPEIISFGKTLKEAKKMAREAIECSLEGMRKEQTPPPLDLEARPITEKVLVSLSS